MTLSPKRIISVLLCSSAFFCSGQNLVFEDVVKLGSEINTHKEDIRPFITTDAESMYFTREHHKRNFGGKMAGGDIWYSQLKKEVGSTAVNNLFKLNNEGDNAVVGMSKDLQTMYLLNRYNRSGYPDGFGISYSKRKNETWSMPKNLKVPNLEYKEGTYDFFMHSNEKVLLISYKNENTIGSEDIYVSLLKDNQWSAPKNLGKVINTTDREVTPFLSEDTKTMYFSSDKAGGVGGLDIYKTERLDNSWEKWSTPVNIGTSINSDHDDIYFSINSELEAYFCSNRVKKSNDVYFSQGVSMTDEELATYLENKKKALSEKDKKSEKRNEKSKDSVTVEEIRESIYIRNGIAVGNTEEVADTVEKTMVKSVLNKKVEGGNQITLITSELTEKEVEELEGRIDSELSQVNETEGDTKTLNYQVGQKLKTILYENDSTEITDDLEDITLILRENIGMRIMIESYSDDAGSEEYNLKISEKRAAKCKAYLVKKGIEENRIDIKFWGEEKSQDSSSNNRRTEIKVSSK